MYDALMREESGFVSELERFLKVHEELKASKTKALHTSWEGEVFENCSEQIAAAVDARSHRYISNRGEALMQEYLTVSNKKAFGVFRDIIIESEYDPLHAQKDHIKYDNRLAHDPCKLELRKYSAKQQQQREPRAEYQHPVLPAPRLGPELWDKLESTPYGRLGKLVPMQFDKPYELSNRITTDQFDMPKGREVLLRELPLGKRCIPNTRPPQWP